MRHLTITNASLSVLVIIVLALLSLLVKSSFSSVPVPDARDVYPVPLTSEFPTIEDQDYTSLSSFIPDLGLSEESWRLEEASVLTKNGDRVGIQGVALLDSPTDLPKQTRLTHCAVPFLAASWGNAPAQTRGFYLALVDGEATPHHLLPLNQHGNWPSARDLSPFNAGADSSKCLPEQD